MLFLTNKAAYTLFHPMFTTTSDSFNSLICIKHDTKKRNIKKKKKRNINAKQKWVD